MNSENYNYPEKIQYANDDVKKITNESPSDCGSIQR